MNLIYTQTHIIHLYVTLVSLQKTFYESAVDFVSHFYSSSNTANKSVVVVRCCNLPFDLRFHLYSNYIPMFNRYEFKALLLGNLIAIKTVMVLEQ